jgi:tetratricopeptide (TPR) repeat protein
MIGRLEKEMILYRPVGLEEMALIYDSGMKSFPARLPQQPIFYPVLDLEYARKTASGWNARNGPMAGYVTRFTVEDEYISQFEEHTVGKSRFQELWIPAEEVEEFNRHITGHIKVVEAHFGEEFEGFIPDRFGLQGKRAVEQFSLLANSYLYKRMDFYLEIKRNHKAVFLNYPFWLTHEFKNPGLKEKILQAIKEAWLTAFPRIPLPLPPPLREESLLVEPVEDVSEPVERTAPFARQLVDPVEEDAPPARQPDRYPEAPSIREERAPVEQTDLSTPENPVQGYTPPAAQAGPDVMQEIEPGFSGKADQAIDELFRAVERNPGDVVARTSLGVAFHRQGQDDRALDCYEAVLEIDPGHAEAHYFRANILYRRGEAREAIAGYTAAIGLEPALIEAHLQPAPQDRLTDYTGSPADMHAIARPARRILQLNSLLESDPRQASLLRERAAEYYRLQNYARAIEDYSSALAIQPNDASTLHLRGVAYEQLGQKERALEDYGQAVAINPQLSNDYINRGVTLGQLGNFRQAIASLTEGVRLAPGNPDVYFNRGVSYLNQGEFERAIEDFSIVIQLSPNDESAYYWRGVSNEEAGRQQQAIADYRQFLRLSQDPRAKKDIEQKLRQWAAGRQESTGRSIPAEDERKRTGSFPAPEPGPDRDLHGLMVALGQRALKSTWFVSGLDCYGEKAKELYALAEKDQPIKGDELLQLTPGIQQTIKGDFQAFDADTDSPWIFIRAWEGSGFYIETDDPKTRDRLKRHFQRLEEVEGASPPYESLFIPIP